MNDHKAPIVITVYNGLTEYEREILYAENRRMNSYYFSFDPTGVPEIDAILSAVAYAAKAYHSTEHWNESGYQFGEGRSYVELIQAAANEAANRLGGRTTGA